MINFESLKKGKKSANYNILIFKEFLCIGKGLQRTAEPS